MIRIKVPNLKLKSFLHGFFLVLAFLGIIFSLQPAALANTLSDLQAKQAQLDKQIEANRQAMEQKQSQINDVQGLINSLGDQIDATQRDVNLSITKIDLTAQEIDQTKVNIDLKTQELQKQKENLFETLRVYYENSRQSTLELVVGSDSLSQAVDKTQYIQSISDQLSQQIDEINKMMAALATQQKDLESQKSDLQNQRGNLLSKKQGLDSQKGEKDQAQSQNLSEKAKIQANLNALVQERSSISDQIYSERQSHGGILYGTSAYPFMAIDVPDPWNFLTRECTSYVSWYVNVKQGKEWYNTQPGRGSARYWDEIAQTLNQQGGHWTISQKPKVGAIVSWKGPLYRGDRWGHVAIVEGIHADGTIDVSEYNWVKYSYDRRVGITPSDYGAYVYIY